MDTGIYSSSVMYVVPFLRLSYLSHPVIAAEGSRQHHLELVNLLALRVCPHTPRIVHDTTTDASDRRTEGDTITLRTCFGLHCIVLCCIASYCIVLKCNVFGSRRNEKKHKGRTARTININPTNRHQSDLVYTTKKRLRPGCAVPNGKTASSEWQSRHSSTVGFSRPAWA